MKLISWNVNGLRAVAGKGFADSFGDFTYTITDAGRAACEAKGI